MEPSPQFLAHTLRIADIRLILETTTDRVGADIDHLQLEPWCWRTWTGPYGTPLIVKPDLYYEISTTDYTDLWFLEADLGTEHQTVIQKKAHVYQDYQASGREQTQTGTFPRVLWVTPNQQRAEAITHTIQTNNHLDPRLHHTVPIDHLANFLADEYG